MNLNFKARNIILAQALLLIALAGNAQSKPDSANNNPAGPSQEELTSTTAKPEESSINWPLMMLVPVFLLGAGLGYYFSVKKAGNKPVIDKQEISNTENEPENKTGKKESANLNKQLKTAQNKITKLEDENSTLQEKYDQLYDEHTDMINFDKAYFEACDKKIISRFRDAVNQKDEKKAVENAFKAIAQLTAISRLKLNIHQAFDEYNINEMIDKTAGSHYKQIDENTNKDTIPDNINTIISILKKNNISGLGNTNFQGYTLNNLDA